jgi:hypothetical protein
MADPIAEALAWARDLAVRAGRTEAEDVGARAAEAQRVLYAARCALADNRWGPVESVRPTRGRELPYRVFASLAASDRCAPALRQDHAPRPASHAAHSAAPLRLGAGRIACHARGAGSGRQRRLAAVGQRCAWGASLRSNGWQRLLTLSLRFFLASLQQGASRGRVVSGRVASPAAASRGRWRRR